MEEDSKKSRKQKNYTGSDIKNLLDTCRTCVNHSSKMFCLFTTERRDLCEEIFFCVGLQVKEGDGLPAKICDQCFKKLHSAYKFKSQCLEADTLLKKHIQSGFKMEPCSNNHIILHDIHETENYDHIKQNNKYVMQCDDPIGNNINYITYKHTVDIKIEATEGDEDKVIPCSVENVEYSMLNDENVEKMETSKLLFNEKVSKSDHCSKKLDIKQDIDVKNYKNEPYELAEDVDVMKFADDELKTTCSYKGITANKKPHSSRDPYLKRMRPMALSVNGSKPVKYRRLYCESCDIKFSSKQELQAHKSQVHQDAERWTCEYCGKKGDRRINYYAHRRRHEIKIDTKVQKQEKKIPKSNNRVPDTLYNGVPNNVSSSANVVGDYKIDDQDDNDKCQGIERKQTRRNRGPYRKRIRPVALLDDGSRPLKFRRLYCEACDLKFKCKKESQAHKRQVHQDAERWSCEYCGKRGDRRMSYYAHRRRHELKIEAESQKNSKLITERGPDTQNGGTSSLKPPHHDISKNNGTRLKDSCDLLKDTTSATIDDDDDDDYVDQFDVFFTNNTSPINKSSAILRGSGESNNIINNIEGDQCQMLNENALIKKKISSAGERVRKKRPRLNQCFCEQCGIKFQNFDHFLEHKRDVHNFNYLCEICGKLSHNRSAQYTHSLIHKLPMLSCDMCDYKSARKTDLIKHINIHTGIKNYICDHCPASFTTVSNLMKHRSVHDAHRPLHCCGRCGKMYTTKRAYDAHMMVHNGQTNQTRYFCKICGTSFYRHYRLSEHLRNKHHAPPPARRRPGRRRLDPAPAAEYLDP